MTENNGIGRVTHLRWQGLACYRAGCILVCGAFVGCGTSADLTQEELKSFRAAIALYRERKFEEAEHKLAPLRRAHAQHLEFAVLQARIQFYTKRSAEAEQTLRQVLRDRPNNPYAAVWLGRVLMLKPDGGVEASAVLRGVLREDPENAMAYYYLGRCLELQGKTREALTAYRRSLAGAMAVSRAHLQSARLLTALQLPERARKHAQRVTRLNASAHDVSEARSLLAKPSVAPDSQPAAEEP